MGCCSGCRFFLQCTRFGSGSSPLCEHFHGIRELQEHKTLGKIGFLRAVRSEMIKTGAQEEGKHLGSFHLFLVSIILIIQEQSRVTQSIRFHPNTANEELEPAQQICSLFLRALLAGVPWLALREGGKAPLLPKQKVHRKEFNTFSKMGWNIFILPCRNWIAFRKYDFSVSPLSVLTSTRG